MKKIPTALLTITLAFTSLTLAETRQWTSADGSKTFPAEFISYDANTGKVTVMKKFKKVSFKTDLLSEDDQQWIKEQAAKSEKKPNSPASTDSSAEDQLIGSKIKKGILKKLSKKHFKRYTLEDPMPEYYVLYFSASW
jgi:hypothetical protein